MAMQSKISTHQIDQIFIGTSLIVLWLATKITVWYFLSGH